MCKLCFISVYMRKSIVGSKTFDAICYLYTNGRIEITLPNHALGWLPIGINDPKIERHIDGLFIVFDTKKSDSTIKDIELK